jgi:hypothetical protein
MQSSRILQIATSVSWLVLLLGPTLVPAQCQPFWDSRATATFGVTGTVRAVHEWDPDGAGPLPPVVAVAGDLRFAAGVPATNLMLYDPVTRSWSSAGGVFQGEVTALAVASNGDLLAGGNFTAVNGQPVHGLARLHLGVWTEIGGGVQGPVAAIAALPGGEVVVAGRITQAGSQLSAIPVANIALWDGLAWSNMGGGVSGTALTGTTGVNALAVDAQGRLVAAGNFINAGGVNCESVAYWQNGTWTGLPVFGPNGALIVRSVAVTANQGLLVSGTAIFGNALIRHWDGAGWNGLGPTFGTPLAVATLPDGSWIASTGMGFGGAGLARWNGSQWVPFVTSSTLVDIPALAPLPSFGTDAIAVGGTFVSFDNLDCLGFSVRIQGAWHGNPVQFQFHGVGRMVLGFHGELLLQSQISQGVPTGGVAQWDGTLWQPVGSGLGFLPQDIAVMADGSLVACADTRGIFRRDSGGVWRPIPGFFAPPPRRIMALPDGRLAAIEPDFQVWDGATWTLSQPFPGFNIAFTAASLARNGDLLLAGNGQTIVRYRGNTWINLNPTLTGPTLGTAIAELADGSVVVGTRLQGVPSRGNIYRGVAGVWTLLAQTTGDIEEMRSDAQGLLYVSGTFGSIQGLPVNGFAVYDGVQWSDGGAGIRGRVRSIVSHPNGDLWLVGTAEPTRYVSRRVTPCPASAANLGGGCASGSGYLSVSPWLQLGEQSNLLATRLPANGLVAFGFGFQSIQVPLTLAPGGAPDCVLRVAAEAVVWRAGGPITELQFAVPNLPGLLGVTVLAQAVGLDPAPPPGGSTLRATPALSLVVGSTR